MKHADDIASGINDSMSGKQKREFVNRIERNIREYHEDKIKSADALLMTEKDEFDGFLNPSESLK